MTRMLAVLAALALVLPAAAAAQEARPGALPGNAAIDQYIESVPTPTGSGRLGPPAAGASLPADQRSRLAEQGSDGRTVAAIIDATPPARSGSQSAGATGDAVLPGGDGEAPLRVIVSAATTGEGGMGLLLPAILLVSLAGIVLVALRRRSSP